MFTITEVSEDAISSNELQPMAKTIADFVAGKKPIEMLTLEKARLVDENPNELLSPKPRELKSIEDRMIAGPDCDIAIRIYQPHSDKSELPGLVFFHGGGFVIGSIKSHDLLVQNLAVEAECVVISVEYRLAPEAKFPAPLEDAMAAYLWVKDNCQGLGIDSDKIAVGGDSAGGNLATVICLRCRDEKLSLPASQLLLYPITDAFSETSSKKDYAAGFFLTSSAMDWFQGHYLDNPSQAKDPYVSPLRAKNLGNLPPTLVITAGFDPLRDEGFAYANRLSEAGVDVTHSCYTSMIHGFMSFAGGIPHGEEGIKESARFLERTLS